METTRKFTEIVTTKLCPEDVQTLRQEAARRGFTELSPFIRELILGSLALPTPTTLMLEVVLGIQFGMYEMAKKAAEGTPLSAARIQSLQEKLETAGGTLTSNFLHRRSQKDKG
jgi:hypothetical protein